MEKRRIRLEINGVVCGLITQESEEYMQSLAQEVGDMMKQVLDASPFVTREAAALTAALSYCDDAKKNGKKAFDLQERVDELEVEAELWQEEKAQIEQGAPEKAAPDPAMLERMRALEERNTQLEEAAGRVAELEARAASLEDENAALREATKPEQEPQDKGGEEAQRLTELLSKLEADNQALRRDAEEQAALARKAEQEKEGAIAAAKRAVEEAKKRVDQMREEAARAKASPALDLLEREAAARAEESGAGRQEASRTERRPAGDRKRRNPLRRGEEYEQEGFVSFFEKEKR